MTKVAFALLFLAAPYAYASEAPKSTASTAEGTTSHKVHEKPFTKVELRRFARGKSVKRPFRIERAGIEYRAGLSYRLVKATPMEVMIQLRRPGGLLRTIPYGVEVATVAEFDGIAKVFIRQGKPPIVGSYTLHLEWDIAQYQARFWLDPAHPHDVEDLWGGFQAREVRPGWTIISFAFAFKIGGLASILEAKAQKWGLSTVDRLARILEQRGTAQKKK